LTKVCIRPAPIISASPTASISATLPISNKRFWRKETQEGVGETSSQRDHDLERVKAKRVIARSVSDVAISRDCFASLAMTTLMHCNY